MEPDNFQKDNAIVDSVFALDPEKSPIGEPFVAVADSKHHFDAAELDGVQRRLKQRHVQM